MLDIGPPEFSGSVKEQLAQIEIWLRNFHKEITQRFMNIDFKSLNYNTAQVLEKGEEKAKENVTLWDIVQIWRKDNLIHRVSVEGYGNVWYMQKVSEYALSDPSPKKRLLITVGRGGITAAGANLNNVLSAYLPGTRRYYGDPIVLINGSSFFMIGELAPVVSEGVNVG